MKTYSVGLVPRNMQEYWSCLNIEDKKPFLEDLYINSELAHYPFEKLPYWIRGLLYSMWDSKWKKTVDQQFIV